MKVVIPGGSGQVGEVLAKAYYAQGHEVVVFSRSPQNCGESAAGTEKL